MLYRALCSSHVSIWYREPSARAFATSSSGSQFWEGNNIHDILHVRRGSLMIVYVPAWNIMSHNTSTQTHKECSQVLLSVSWNQPFVWRMHSPQAPWLQLTASHVLINIISSMHKTWTRWTQDLPAAVPPSAWSPRTGPPVEEAAFYTSYTIPGTALTSRLRCKCWEQAAPRPAGHPHALWMEIDKRPELTNPLIVRHPIIRR